MRLENKILIAVGSIMIATMVVIFLLGFVEAREWNDNDTLNTDCDTMDFGGGAEGNWTLGYLRNLSRYCSG